MDDIEILGALTSGEQGRVVRGRDAHGFVVIKTFADAAAFARALAAYERLEQSEELRKHLAKRVAADPEKKTLVLREVRGRPPKDADDYAALGRFVGALRDETAGEDDDELSLPEALSRRFAHAMDIAGSALSVDEVVAAQERFSAEAFAGERRSLCHGDVRADNVIVDSQRLVVIDFGQARYDHWLRDVVKVLCDEAVTPRERTAFLDGAGVAADEWERLQSMVVLHGLLSVAWGLRHDDGERVSDGRRVLRGSRAGLGDMSMK